MKKLSVVAHTVSIRLFGHSMDHLHYLSVFEEQCACRAAPALPFQECGDPERHFRVFAQSLTPIDPIAVVRTAAALHFYMSPNRSAAVPVQLVITAGRLKPPTFSFGDTPVLVHNPPLALVRMAAFGPTKESREERIFNFRKDDLAYYRGVISTPADNQRVQRSNESRLLFVLMLAHRLSESIDMSLYGTLARFDEELEPYPIPQGVFTRLRFPYRVLSDIEPEKGETRFTRKRVMRVSDASLAGLQF